MIRKINALLLEHKKTMPQIKIEKTIPYSVNTLNIFHAFIYSLLPFSFFFHSNSICTFQLKETRVYFTN